MWDPYDFSIAMGYPGEYDHPRVKEPMRDILDLCLKHKVPSARPPQGRSQGLSGSLKGCQFFELVSELSLISAAATQAVARTANIPQYDVVIFAEAGRQ